MCWGVIVAQYLPDGKRQINILSAKQRQTDILPAAERHHARQQRKKKTGETDMLPA